MSIDVESHVIYRIANAAPRHYPFPHVIVEDVFPAAFYARLIANLPASADMKPIAAVRPVSAGTGKNRHVVNLDPAEVAAMREPVRGVWQDMASWMLREPFARALVTAFGPFLQQRFRDQPDVVIKSEARFVEDQPGFEHGPHTDAPWKVLSLIFYLPDDDASQHLGTGLYVPRDPNFRCRGGPHYPFDKFRHIFTVPYRRNAAFMFVKSEQSFHGVEPIVQGGRSRHLILYDICWGRSSAAPSAAQ